MTITKAEVMREVEGKIALTPLEIPPLQPDEVLLKITHSGLCHSDLFYISSGMALGHEGVGTVEAIGSAVSNFKLGDRAGGGYHRNVSDFCNLVAGCGFEL
jgi:D-arabinose 1-dehydrogenase-like Zn-dependent alcohol dehydrogenase